MNRPFTSPPSCLQNPSKPAHSTTQPFFASGDLKQIDKAKLPVHVAIIPDGNRRWAKRHFLDYEEGHVAGIEAIIKIVLAAKELGIRMMTVFGFSTENYSKRSETEIEHLLRIIKQYLTNYQQKLIANNIRLRTIGDTQTLPTPLRMVLDETVAKTSSCSEYDLMLAINYGGRNELVRAMKKIAGDIVAGKLAIEAVDESCVASYLDTAGMPDPDLLIRTGGEERISNFLLWQSSYAEVYIDEIPWPDFTPKHLLAAVLDFQHRQRRIGGGTYV